MKKSISLFLIAGLIFTLDLTVTGQRCITNELREKHIQNDPSIIGTIKTIETQTQQWISANRSQTEQQEILTIPVVVHVIWRLNEENISDEQIYSQMEVLNEDFRKLNDNFYEGPGPFQALGADIQVEFCLASVDPNGDPTSGITRTQTFEDDIGMYEFYESDWGGKDAWDIEKYVNIWVCDLGDDGTLGFASPPGTADPPESDGMVIGYEYFGTTGVAAGSYPNDLGRTTTHEMGHYLNLEHLWGVYDGGCNEDDFVSDTPNQYEPSEGCPDFPFLDDCTPAGNGIMFNNFMDYTDDECMTMFTQGQKMRMLAALNGPRSGLLTSNGCNSSSSVNLVTQETFKIYPNPVTEILQFQNQSISAEKSIEIEMLNILGEKIIQFELRSMKSLNISAYPDGIYFIRSVRNPGNIKRIIISK